MIAILATVFAALAALLHVYIFVMESVQWTQPKIWKRFGVRDQAAADTTKPMAYNQGFYNLFLAIGTAIGLVLFWTGADAAGEAAGKALVLFSLGSMVAAALVLVTSGKGYARAAATQGTLPLIGFVLFLFAVAAQHAPHRPAPAACAAACAADEEGMVRVVRLDAQGLGVARGHELVVQEPAVVGPQVEEAPVVAVPAHGLAWPGRIEADPHGRALGCERREVRAGLVGPALRRRRALRGVDADQAHPDRGGRGDDVVGGVVLQLDGVAVEDVADRHRERVGGRAGISVTGVGAIGRIRRGRAARHPGGRAPTARRPARTSTTRRAAQPRQRLRLTDAD